VCGVGVARIVATSYNTSGFNYVVFDENAVNIEKQTQLEGMEISKKDLKENLNNIIYTKIKL
jgi:hypothetical protein